MREKEYLSRECWNLRCPYNIHNSHYDTSKNPECTLSIKEYKKCPNVEYSSYEIIGEDWSEHADADI